MQMNQHSAVCTAARVQTNLSTARLHATSHTITEQAAQLQMCHAKVKQSVTASRQHNSSHTQHTNPTKLFSNPTLQPQSPAQPQVLVLVQPSQGVQLLLAPVHVQGVHPWAQAWAAAPHTLQAEVPHIHQPEGEPHTQGAAWHEGVVRHSPAGVPRIRAGAGRIPEVGAGQHSQEEGAHHSSREVACALPEVGACGRGVGP